MKGKRSTRTALLSSVLALVLCVAMLVGATFAWFTDTASTSVNKIQSGALEVLLLDEYGNDLEGKTLEWDTNDNRAQDQILWEPGCTYDLQSFKIKNSGNLALKYKIVISGIAGSAKLNEAIDWTYKVGDDDVANLSAEGRLAAGAETDLITITGHMQETAGNEYQNLTIDGIGITVVATQDTVENDSYGNQYDSLSEYDKVVTSAADITSGLADGAKVVLADSLKLSENLSINNDVTIIGNGTATITDYPVFVGAENTVTFTNVNFANTTATEKASSVYGSGFKGTIVFDGCTFGDSNWESVQITPKGDATIVFKNCTFTATKDMKRFIHIQPAGTNDYKLDITIFGCTFMGCEKVNYSTSDKVSVIDLDYIASGSKLTLGGCTFKNTDGTVAADAHAYFCKPAPGYEMTYDYDAMYSMLTGEVQTVTVP